MAADAGSRVLYYVYALCGPGLPRTFDAGGRTLRAIDIDGVSAIVELVQGAPETTEQTLREQHAIVGLLAGRARALLPVRFGALFTPAELDARVKSAHDVILDALDRVRGRVQMTVRLQPAPGEPTTASRFSTGTAYLVARSERERALRRSAAALRRAVSRLVVDERIEPGKGDLQGSVYHLIQAGDADRYRAALEAFAPSLAPVRVTVTGPWPVFAFAPDLDRG